MVEQSQDLEGNIQMDSFEEGKRGADNSGFRTEDNRPASSASSQHSGIDG